MNSQKLTKKMTSKRKAISPILATVILLGIAIVAGGIVFSLFSTSAQTASTADVISVQNAQGVRGTSHADVTATVKNAGSQPWTKVEMTVSKSELSEPLLYESLHENAVGCNVVDTSDNDCNDAGEDPAGNRDNPLRMQWLATLDKTAGDEGVADSGEGISVGRKLVFESKDSYRTVLVLNGTAVGPVFGLSDQNGDTSYNGDIDGSDLCTTAHSASWQNCTPAFKALDSSTKGNILCRAAGGDTTNEDVECKVFTHSNIEDSPVAAGKSIQFYADAFVSEVPGLDNQVVRAGDSLVVNIVTENEDGGSARAQTIIKVTGV